MTIPTQLYKRKIISQKDTVKVVYFPIRNRSVSCKEKKYKVFYDSNGEIITREAYNLNKSLERTRRTIHELALCNSWSYFITLTFDIKKYDSYDLDKTKSLIQYFERYLRDRKCQFLVIPEFHKDKKKIHFHGLISGELPLIDSGCVKLPNIKKPLRLETCQKRNYDLTDAKKLYNLPSWSYGYASVMKIGDSPLDNLKVSQYLTKYVTKDLITLFNRHRYYCSKSLNRNKLFTEDNVFIRDGIFPILDNMGNFLTYYTTRYQCLIQIYEKPKNIDFEFDEQTGTATFREILPL